MKIKSGIESFIFITADYKGRHCIILIFYEKCRKHLNESPTNPDVYFFIFFYFDEQSLILMMNVRTRKRLFRIIGKFSNIFFGLNYFSIQIFFYNWKKNIYIKLILIKFITEKNRRHWN